MKTSILFTRASTEEIVGILVIEEPKSAKWVVLNGKERAKRFPNAGYAVKYAEKCARELEAQGFVLHDRTVTF